MKRHRPENQWWNKLKVAKKLVEMNHVFVDLVKNTSIAAALYKFLSKLKAKNSKTSPTTTNPTKVFLDFKQLSLLKLS